MARRVRRARLDAALLRGEGPDRLDRPARPAPPVRPRRAGAAGADRPGPRRRLLARRDRADVRAGRAAAHRPADARGEGRRARRTIRQLTAMRDGLRHAAACPAPSHMECPTFRRIVRAAAAGLSARDGSRWGSSAAAAPSSAAGGHHAGEVYAATWSRSCAELLGRELTFARADDGASASCGPPAPRRARATGARRRRARRCRACTRASSAPRARDARGCPRLRGVREVVHRLTERFAGTEDVGLGQGDLAGAALREQVAAEERARRRRRA